VPGAGAVGRTAVTGLCRFRARDARAGGAAAADSEHAGGIGGRFIGFDRPRECLMAGRGDGCLLLDFHRRIAQ